MTPRTNSFQVTSRSAHSIENFKNLQEKWWNSWIKMVESFKKFPTVWALQPLKGVTRRLSMLEVPWVDINASKILSQTATEKRKQSPRKAVFQDFRRARRNTGLWWIFPDSSASSPWPFESPAHNDSKVRTFKWGPQTTKKRINKTRCRPSKGWRSIPDVIIWVHVETYLNVYG